MRAFAKAWPEEPIVQASLAQITWYHPHAAVLALGRQGQRAQQAEPVLKPGRPSDTGDVVPIFRFPCVAAIPEGGLGGEAVRQGMIDLFSAVGFSEILDGIA
jgi:hypothetical protein